MGKLEYYESMLEPQKWGNQILKVPCRKARGEETMVILPIYFQTKFFDWLLTTKDAELLVDQNTTLKPKLIYYTLSKYSLIEQ